MEIFITSDWVLLFIRLVLGFTFVYYGLPKIKDLKANAEDFSNNKGFYPGILWGTLIAFLEVFGGIAVALGIYAELIALALVFHMATGTFWKIKNKKAFTNWSYDIQLFSLSVVVAFFGAGEFTILNFDASPFLRWDVAIGAIVLSALFAFSSGLGGSSGNKE